MSPPQKAPASMLRFRRKTKNRKRKTTISRIAAAVPRIKSSPARLACPSAAPTMIKKPFQPISPVTKLDGHELLLLNGPILIRFLRVVENYHAVQVFQAGMIADFCLCLEELWRQTINSVRTS